MCCCGKPTVNGQKDAYSWDGVSFMTRHPTPPKLNDDEKLIFDEPGRCGGIDAHCHHFSIAVTPRGNDWYLYVVHGAGQEKFRIKNYTTHLIESMKLMDSDSRYWVMHSIYSTVKQWASDVLTKERHEWAKAFVEKRIKKRKRGGTYTVHIEYPTTSIAE